MTEEEAVNVMDNSLVILGLTALDPAYLHSREKEILQGASHVLVPSAVTADAVAACGLDVPITIVGSDNLDWSRGGRLVYCSPGAPIPTDAAAAVLQQWAAAEGAEIEVIQGMPIGSGLGRQLPEGMNTFAPVIGPNLISERVCCADDLWVESIWSAEDLARTVSSLCMQYPASHRLMLLNPGAVSARWLGSTAVPTCAVRTLTLENLEAEFVPGAMTLLYVPLLPLESRVRRQLVEAGQAFAGLMGVVHRLRAPGGCPWDQEQTHASLRPFLLEECHELMEALTAERPDQIRDELGDVLLQVLLHSLIGRESGEFTIGDVMAGLSQKMIQRHPHVFAGTRADTAADVEASWERIKKRQRENDEEKQTSVLDSIPAALPALLQAEKVQSVVSRVGFDWDDVEGPVAKIREEVEEFVASDGLSERGRELGDLLFSLVNLSRFLSLSAETELLGTITRFRRRFEAIEEGAGRQGLELKDMSLRQMDRIWEQHKAGE